MDKILKSIFLLLIITGCKQTDTTDIYNLACEYEKKKEYTKAIDLLTKVIEIDSTDLEAYNNRAWDYKDLGHFDNALKDFNNILRLDKKNTAGLYGKGIIYYNQKKYQMSIDMFDKIIKINGGGPVFMVINDDAMVGKRIPRADIDKVYHYKKIAEEKIKTNPNNTYK